ncbi:hypothetical protein C0J52_03372 [Blattella germanica]|nr:hypothetical protein C0J52_03372 [Blattella germanica]
MGLKKLIWFHRRDDYPQVPDDGQLLKRRGGNAFISLICSSTLVYGAIILLLAVAVPVLVYMTVFAENPDFVSACMKGISSIDQTRCENYGCCWNETDRACYHSLPSRHSYCIDNWVDASTAVNQLHNTNMQLSNLMLASPYGRKVADNLNAAAVPVTETHLRFFLWNTTGDSPTLPQGINITTSKFKVEVYGPDYFSFEIVRRDDNAATLLTTSKGPIIASINYWELTLQFPEGGQVFGLGELHLSTSSKVIYNNADRLGANPFVMALDSKGRAHGVLFNNPGPLEFEMLADSNILIVRSLSTMYWDFSVFAGPTPADVMEQYTSERRPILPPKWALGLHICRETNETAALDDLNEFITSAKALGLPYESDCLQDRFLGDLNFTIPDYVTPLIEAFQSSGKKIMVSLQPQVQPSVATQQDLFVLDEDGSLLQDEYRGIAVSFPDMLRTETGEWLKGKLQGLQLGSNLGGYVLLDEWPSVNSSEDSDIERMDYVPDIVLSSATFTGSGTVSGSHSHEFNEVPCTWSNMISAQKTVLGQGLAGIPLAGGGPVCGNIGDYDDELCLRWYLMSSMLPLMRVSSVRPLRDPVNLNAFNSIVKNVVINRYSVLAYMYSLFLEAQRTGVPVARPMFFEFPSDSYTWLRSDHFMLGPALLVRPVFVPGGVSVQVYLPQEDVPWFHFHGGHQINNGTGGYEVRVPSLTTELVGIDSITVEGTLATKYSLTVGMNCLNSSSCMAVGSLQVGLDSSWTATADENGLQVEGTCGSTSVPHIDSVLVYGMNLTDVKTVQVSVDPAKCSVTSASAEIQEQNSVLSINSLDVDFCCGEPVRIAWTFS